MHGGELVHGGPAGVERTGGGGGLGFRRSISLAGGTVVLVWPVWVPGVGGLGGAVQWGGEVPGEREAGSRERLPPNFSVCGVWNSNAHKMYPDSIATLTLHLDNKKFLQCATVMLRTGDISGT